MPRKPKPAPYDGALVIDKPRGKTSHDVVDVVRRLAGFRQVGHLGTLDPLATGVLVLLLGRATRLAQFYAGRRKRYTAAIRFGFATDTYDADGEPQGPDTAPALDGAVLERLAAERVGRFPQMPPPFSAKKIHGKPAHELGERVGCGAHLSEIVRTAVGEFALDQAIPVEELVAAANAGRFSDCVIPLERLLPNFPRVNVLPVVERRVRHGTRFNILVSQIQAGQAYAAQGATSQLDSGEPRPPRLRVFNQQDKLIAIAEAVVPRTYQPIVVLDAEP